MKQFRQTELIFDKKVIFNVFTRSVLRNQQKVGFLKPDRVNGHLQR